jgi:PAS domain-containing protein
LTIGTAFSIKKTFFFAKLTSLSINICINDSFAVKDLNMNIEKGNLLSLMNPCNFKLKTKIHLLIFSSVLFTVILVIVMGFFMLRSILIKNTLRQLEELTYLKNSEVVQNYKITSERLLNLAANSKTIEASKDLKNGFKLLRDEKYELFSADSIKEIKTILTHYYNKDIADLYVLSADKISNYIPQNDLTLVGQYLYIFSLNANLPAEKRKTVTFADYSSYSQAHSNYHSYFLQVCEQFHAQDIYLIDPVTGDVVYSVNKNIDFASNLYNDRFRKSPLSTAFRMAVAVNLPVVSFVDYSSYVAAYDQPVAFLSLPVYSEGELISIMVVQISSGFFEDVLYDKYMLATNGSLEYNIIGEDLYLRNNPRALLTDSKTYFRVLEKRASRRDIDKILNYKKTGSMVMLAQYPFIEKAKILSEQNLLLKDYNNKEVLVSIKKLDIPGTNLFMISKINLSEALSNYFHLLKIFVFVFIGLLIIIYIIGKYFAEALKNRIALLRDSLMFLYRGEQPKALNKGAPDEIGETVGVYNNLRDRISTASEFALEMSEGNFNHEFEVLSEADSLGKSLNILKQKMIQSKIEQDKRQKEDEIRNWINTGIAKFNDLLRQNNDDIHALSYSLIENLIDYLGANQGGVFLVEGDNIADKHISLVAGFAYDRRKYQKKNIEIGEGLLGNIYLEKKSIYLKDIPEEYIEIKSGLGQSSPRYLYIVPLKVDDEVLGMIELASLNEFVIHHIEFIEKVSESIASTFVSVRLNMQTARLLDESNRRSEEIKQQEEEMRQNLEEMQATQEELTRLRTDDDKRTREMQAIIDNSRRMMKNILDAIPGGYVLKDQDGIVYLANQEGASFYDLSADDLKGKSDNELLESKLSDVEHKTDLEVLSKGDIEYVEEKEINGEKKKYRVIKKPLYIEELHHKGILTIRYQVDK